MSKSNDFILLKWGTLKAWNFSNSPESQKAYEEYEKIGFSLSAIMQEDTLKQKELICEMIDKVNGNVQSDWTGEDWTDCKYKAKEYVMNYGEK